MVTITRIRTYSVTGGGDNDTSYVAWAGRPTGGNLLGGPAPAISPHANGMYGGGCAARPTFDKTKSSKASGKRTGLRCSSRGMGIASHLTMKSAINRFDYLIISWHNSAAFKMPLLYKAKRSTE